MKKILTATYLFSIFLLVSGFTSTTQIDKTSDINVIATDNVIVSDFNEGWYDGWCEGWKDVKGEGALCPNIPLPPNPPLNKNNYRGGYNMGFKAGTRAAS